MVLGLGTDLIETKRVQESIDRFGERFLERIFTAGEIAYCMRKKRIRRRALRRDLRRKRPGRRRWGPESAAA